MTMPEPMLQNILANPADDGPRLVAADWLEEQGECERAEFIRVQCELAGIKCDSCKGRGSYSLRAAGGYGQRGIPCDDCCAKTLRRREAELLEANASEWMDDLPDRLICGHIIDRATSNPRVFFRRGFIEQVECRLADWRGERCGRCAMISSPKAQISCQRCHGLGRTGGIGPLLVERCPLRRVVVADKKPTDYGRNDSSDVVFFEPGLSYDLPHQLPFHFCTSANPDVWKADFPMSGLMAYPFRNADAAFDALSAALLEEAGAKTAVEAAHV